MYKIPQRFGHIIDYLQFTNKNKMLSNQKSYACADGMYSVVTSIQQLFIAYLHINSSAKNLLGNTEKNEIE